jgi:hypothetical protein
MPIAWAAVLKSMNGFAISTVDRLQAAQSLRSMPVSFG